MASRTVGLIQDQNLTIHYNGASIAGKANISKAPRKGGISGRKPLGDLSNSVIPTPNQTSKKDNAKFSFTEKETGASKLTHDSSKKKSVSKGSEKVQGGGRKALSDISNSGKPCLQETSKKNQTEKLSILAEDPNQPKDIAQEGYLHNHEECIKAQKRAISTNEFLRILGLDDFSKQSASAKEPPMSNKMMPMSPPRNFEAGQMTELLIEDLSPPKHKLSRKLDSAPPSPEPLDHYMHWNDPEYILSFKLIESP
ncbi:uncharacterized protein LOC111307712 [Durio zibethinus]|uniref:Uncharacterized protein LOC111307712 n=1 Tax=Durio zibethinus TaxID=66656 RepID=A0A6P6A9L7_DURZI|nr:uncharacterized protein LOC111307712 [Durio zibethinus]